MSSLHPGISQLYQLATPLQTYFPSVPNLHGYFLCVRFNSCFFWNYLTYSQLFISLSIFFSYLEKKKETLCIVRDNTVTINRRNRTPSCCSIPYLLK